MRFAQGFVCALAVVAAMAAVQLDPIFDSLEVDGETTVHGTTTLNGVTVTAGDLDINGSVLGVSVLPTTGNTEHDVRLFVGGTPEVGTWNSGLAGPGGTATGVAYDTNGDILLCVASGFYRHDGSAWGSIVAGPSVASRPLQGITVDASNRDVLVASGGTDRIYRYNGSSWDSGIAGPSGSNLVGVVLDGTDILAMDEATDRVFRYDGSSWDAGIPTGQIQPGGLAVSANGSILMVDITTDRIYSYDGTSWDAGFPVPSAVLGPQGLAVTTTGNILVVDGSTNTTYEIDVTNASNPSSRGWVRWTGSVWQVL